MFPTSLLKGAIKNAARQGSKQLTIRNLQQYAYNVAKKKLKELKKDIKKDIKELAKDTAEEELDRLLEAAFEATEIEAMEAADA